MSLSDGLIAPVQPVLLDTRMHMSSVTLCVSCDVGTVHTDNTALAAMLGWSLLLHTGQLVVPSMALEVYCILLGAHCRRG